MLDKSKSSVQDTKSTRNRTSVFTTELNKHVHESKQCTYSVRGTQRIVSVNYLFGRPLISSDFLETIVTLHFRDMRNLMSVAFGLSKLSFLVP